MVGMDEPLKRFIASKVASCVGSAAALVAAFIALFGARSAFAAGDSDVPGSRYISARGAALGDAFLPLGDDAASALFYNPADFGKIRKPDAEPVHFEFGLNSGAVGNFGINSYKLPSLSSYQPTLAGSPGSYQGFQGAIMPTYAMKDFGFGLLAQTITEARVNSDGSITYRSVYQIIPAAGFAIRLAEGIVRIGYSVQYVNESVGTNTVPSDTSPLGYNQSLNTGWAFSQNVGFALTLPITYLPSFNFVARNIGGANYNSGGFMPLTANPVGTPGADPMTLDASISIAPKFTADTGFNIVLEDRDLTDTSGVSQMDRLALGVEYEIHHSFFLRGGWGDGYPCFGFGVKKLSGELSLTRYTEQIGGAGDTRYLLEYQVHAF
jgi:hypothetical protein